MSGSAARRRRRGQSLVLVAILLPFVTLFLLTCLEIGARWWEVAQAHDALLQASRSAVQTFAYAQFARNAATVADDDAVTAVGNAVFTVNLTGVHGLADAPATVAAQVRWTVLPKGGTCSFGGRQPPVSATTPLVCAEVQPRMRGLLGWGSYTPTLTAAATLDTTTAP